MSVVIAIGLFLLVNSVSVENSQPLLASSGRRGEECDTLKAACLSKMREEPSASIEEGQRWILSSKELVKWYARGRDVCEGDGRRKSTKWQAGKVELCGSSNGTTGRSTKEDSCSERKVSRNREDADQGMEKV